MSAVAGLGVDERRARVALSLLAEPDDPVTGGMLRRVGAVETLGLLDTDMTVPGLGRVDGQVWRDRLTSPGRLDGLEQRLRMVEESGIATLIPGDGQWPRALDDLGDRAPYVLFVRGTTSFLARPLNDLVTVTGSTAWTVAPLSMSWRATSRTVSVFWWLVVLMVSRLPCTARCWRPVGTRSRCSPVAWTAPTRAGTVTCWSGWVMWVHWSASFLPDQCRRGIGS